MAENKRYTVEGYWDCQYCKSVGIPGRHKVCPNCGHARDASVTFYTKDISAENAISEEEFARETTEADKNSRSSSVNHSGPVDTSDDQPSLYSRKAGEGRGDARDQADTTDWYCDYCQSYNPASATTCRYCGADREMSEGKTYQQERGTMARTYDKHGNLVSERDLSGRKQPEPEPAPSGGGGCMKFVIIAAIIALAIGGLMMFILSPKTHKITVASFDWTRTIEIEEVQTVQESDWLLPDNARIIRTTKEVRTYEHLLDHYEEVPYQVSEQVLDHYEKYTTTVDNGDGSFEVEEHSEPVYRTEYRTEYRSEPVYIDVPVYDTKYYYEVERWVHTRDVTTSGTDHNPYWGEVTLSGATGDNGVGQEREGKRSATYGVTDSKGKRYTAEEEFWTGLSEGQELKVTVDKDGNILD